MYANLSYSIDQVNISILLVFRGEVKTCEKLFLCCLIKDTTTLTWTNTSDVKLVLQTHSNRSIECLVHVTDTCPRLPKEASVHPKFWCCTHSVRYISRMLFTIKITGLQKQPMHPRPNMNNIMDRKCLDNHGGIVTQLQALIRKA